MKTLLNKLIRRMNSSENLEHEIYPAAKQHYNYESESDHSETSPLR
jgi:hypothetical protein